MGRESSCGGYILVKNTKSKRRRYVRMNDTVMANLKPMSEAKESNHVFVDPESKEAILSIERAWKKALRQAKIRNFRFHDIRHTFASRLVQAWVAIPVVKDLLGHQDITTTMRYAHLLPADLRDAVEKLAPRKAVDPPPSKAEEKKDEPKS